MTFIEFDDFCRMCKDWNHEEVHEEIIIDHLKQDIESATLSGQGKNHCGLIADEIRDEVLL